MWNPRVITVVAVLGLLILGAILSLGLTGCKKEDKGVKPTNNGQVAEVTIPAIDAAVPMRTESATFALG